MFIGCFNIVSIVTYLGMSASVLSCFLSFQKQFLWALIVLMLTALCDLFAEPILKTSTYRDNAQKSMCRRLVMLTQILGYGVAPVIAVYNLGFGNIWFLLLYIIFVVCLACRIAYNDSQLALPKEKRGATGGLPYSTFALLLAPLMFLEKFASSFTGWIFVLLLLLLSVLYLLKLNIRKPGIQLSFILLGVEVLFIVAYAIAASMIH